MGENSNNIDASEIIKEEWKDELKLIENYIFGEITKKIDTYDIEDIVKSCVEKSDGIKEILQKLSAIEGMLMNISNQLLYSGTYTSSPGTYNPSWSVNISSLTAAASDESNQVDVGDLLKETMVDNGISTKCGK